MKKILPVILVFILLAGTLSVFAETDEFIFSDPVRDTFFGRVGADALIANLNFTDMPGHPAFEAVARVGALNIIKGYDDTYYSDFMYRPSDLVSNVEMLGTVFRAMGMDDTDAAVARLRGGDRIPIPPGGDLSLEIANGYIILAEENRLIDDTLIYDDPVTRQQAVAWLYAGLNLMDGGSDAFESASAGSVQKTYNFSDWRQVSGVNLEAIEAFVAAGILKGDTNGKLRPNDSLTRAELAYICKRLDVIYYDLVGIEKRNGTVGGFKEHTSVTTGSGAYARSVYVRASDGIVDVLSNLVSVTISAEPELLEVPVFREDEVTGLYSLEEGDEIEYLVKPETGEVLYVQVVKTNPVVIEYIKGKFQSVNAEDGTITIKDESGGDVVFFLADGMYYTVDEKVFIYVDYNNQRDASELPVGSTIVLRLVNNICDEITYIGEPNLAPEFRGVVIENNADLGYLLVIDNRGKTVIKDFYPSDIKVKKMEYYHNDDEIGYISDVFPYFKYNPLDSDIYAIEPGDIVFITNDPENPDYIKNISASTNYVARYGKILQFNYNGEYYEMLLEYENKQTAWFDVSEQLFISRNGKPATAETVAAGEWARVLVNQAVISPGFVIESVKEIVLEGSARNISTILRGQFAGINPTQNELKVQNVQTLTNKGWSDYKQTSVFSLTGRDTEYYMDGEQISLDYALKYLKRAEGEVYIALEKTFSGEKVRKVTFRSGRDELLAPDTVINADGNGNFYVLSNDGTISTDAGTIVRRYGRLVDGTGIMFPDYAVVSLNDGPNAAVVDIIDAPGNERTWVYRGTVTSVDMGKTFSVKPMFILSGTEWLYTPVQRPFVIDNKSKLVFQDGIVPLDKLADYNSQTDPSVTTSIGKEYNIISYDGVRADWVVDSPGCPYSVRGTVYQTDAGAIYIKDAEYLNPVSPWQWRKVNNGAKSATLVIKIPPNSLILKNNEVAGINNIETGNRITVMTNALTPAVPDAEQGADAEQSAAPADPKTPPVTGGNVDGFIVFVDKY